MSATDRDGGIDLSLDELCERCGFTHLIVTNYVQEGLLDIEGEDVSLWRFSETHLLTLQKVYRLESDLRLNPAGAVLAHELMLEIESLKKKLQRSSHEQ